jgi:hypothetical protein
MEDEKDSETDAGEAGGIIPAEFFAEIGDGKDGENGERDDFLNRFELSGAELVRADAIGGNLKAVFEKGDAPAGEDNFPQSFAAEFEVAVPGEGHEDIGNREKKDRTHGDVAPRKRRLDAKSF